ncbi:MAG: polyprenyl synthetase family protein [Holosporales bacterium]|nr:polyprenyl synthetase family protein [Holosporales bacterium]
MNHELKLIDETLHSLLRTDFFGEYYHQMLSFVLGGKRLRSILFLIIAKRFCEDGGLRPELSEKQRWTIGLIEAVHLASLIHDDIIDDNSSRRCIDACHELLGRKFSVLLGDYIFAHASKKFLRLHHEDQFIQNMFLRECSSTVLGAVLEQKLTMESSVKDCLRVTCLKTSPFFKLSCFMGAYSSSSNFQLSIKAATFGTCFGMIYQIQNDLNCYKFNDYSESEDYMQRNVTLPILLLYHSLGFNAFNIETTSQMHYETIQEKLNAIEFKSALNNLVGKYYKIIENVPAKLNLINA